MNHNGDAGRAMLDEFLKEVMDGDAGVFMFVLWQLRGWLKIDGR
jgi:hypothetical protein